MGPENSVSLKTMYVTLAEDELEEEYSAMDEPIAAGAEEAPW
jgi:hypothetical protein